MTYPSESKRKRRARQFQERIIFMARAEALARMVEVPEGESIRVGQLLDDVMERVKAKLEPDVVERKSQEIEDTIKAFIGIIAHVAVEAP